MEYLVTLRQLKENLDTILVTVKKQIEFHYAYVKDAAKAANAAADRANSIVALAEGKYANVFCDATLTE